MASAQLVAFTWKYFVAHPEFVTLLNSENLHRAPPPARRDGHRVKCSRR